MTGLRERKHEQTRQAFIDALRSNVLAGIALDDLTVETISDVADMSARTFFRYFDTKADCALAACGIPRAAWQLPLDEGLLIDLDARLLRTLVRAEGSHFLGLVFEKLTGGLRPRFVPVAEALDVVLDPAFGGAR